MTSAKWLRTWQNSRDTLTDLLGRPREQMTPLPNSVAEYPELLGAVRIGGQFGGQAVGGREGTFDGREYSEVRGWMVVDFRPPLVGRFNFVPFKPDELEPADSRVRRVVVPRRALRRWSTQARRNFTDPVNGRWTWTPRRHGTYVVRWTSRGVAHARSVTR